MAVQELGEHRRAPTVEWHRRGVGGPGWRHLRAHPLKEVSQPGMPLAESEWGGRCWESEVSVA